MKKNPSWTQFRISSFSNFAYAWIKGERHSQISKLGYNSMCMPNILPTSSVIYTSVPSREILESFLPGSGESSLSESMAGEIVAQVRKYPPNQFQFLSCQQVSQFIVSLNWATGLVPLGCLHLRPLQRHFYAVSLLDWFTPPR